MSVEDEGELPIPALELPEERGLRKQGDNRAGWRCVACGCGTSVKETSPGVGTCDVCDQTVDLTRNGVQLTGEVKTPWVAPVGGDWVPKW